MKEIVLILSKTRMNHHQVCVGGLTMEGRYVRLLDKNGHNQPEDIDFEPRQAWEIEYSPRTNNTPPHVEDVIVQNRISKGRLKNSITIKDFIEKRNIPIWRGHPDNLFDRLIQWTENGSGYIDKRGGIPDHSVGFWISDKDLWRHREFDSIRYFYPSSNGRRKIKFKGFEGAVKIIPAGTLLRVSLARWVSFGAGESLKCWLQLSGWYDLGEHSDEEDDLPF
ncbi:hypothetical protein [Prolixibacter sp. NT017]|uniref:dual OB domain-containing protein n=1 Tax=Prolixibacter sp. NT017 TaxID=2652390 RepID=UPI0012706903|nr:hypothetical protein [Prolixibacter sp. NT017]GET25658.1 hypothetical protein NT017_19870 [Prolixibacter sp. NT017]